MKTLQVLIICMLTVECFGDLSSSGPHRGLNTSEPLSPQWDGYAPERQSGKDWGYGQSDQGSSGPPQTEEEVIKELKDKLQTMRKTLTQYFNDFPDLLAATNNKFKDTNLGNTFVRWGREDCPPGNEQVYIGYAGGSHYDHNGGAADYICLTNKPAYMVHDSEISGNGGLVYGAEYETFWNDIVKQNMDVPCVVCRSNHSSVVMIPGTDECSSKEWSLEYDGFLSSGAHDQRSATQFVCVDSHPVARGSPVNADGKLFYTVEGQCGSLPCAPYVEGNELRCAVCSK